MTAQVINIYQLKPFINAGFASDWEILKYYDKSVRVESIEAVCDNVFDKIKTMYPDATLVGLYKDEEKVGYFAYEERLLVSFALHKWVRNQEAAKELWDIIRSYVGDSFQCFLYSYNVRAVNFLKKCGMQVWSEEVTILTI